MKTNPINERGSIAISADIGTVTREMVHSRAAELAVLDGRLSKNATISDLAHAKRELTGELD